MLFLLSACGSNYFVKVGSAHSAYFRGDYKKSVEILKSIQPAPRDRLVYLLDLGMSLNAAGDYAESNKVLEEAEKLSDELRPKSVSQEVAGTFSTEEVAEYAGDRHERILIPVIRMLNYILLDDWNGALVEVRRVETLVEREYGKDREEFRNAFATYLSAVIWESLGYSNDAFIDYKRLSKYGENVPYYSADLSAMSKRTGLAGGTQNKGHVSWEVPAGYRGKDLGQFIVIVMTGRSPQYVSEYVSTGIFSAALPTLVYKPDDSKINIKLDGDKTYSVEDFYSIVDDMVLAMKDRRKRAVVKKIIKLTVQNAMATAGWELSKSDDKAEQGAGIALGILSLFMQAAEKADERSWRVLPQNFRLGRFYVAKGDHKVEITDANGGNLFNSSVNISGGKPRVLLVHAPTNPYERDVHYGETSRRVAKAMAEEKELIAKLAKDPKNGELRVDLAFARMRRGDFDVEVLFTDAIKRNAAPRTAYLGLAIVNFVKGRYEFAAKWSADGGYAQYESAAKFLLGTSATVEKINESRDGDFEKGFSYFVMGLVDQKNGDNDGASVNFSKAVEFGMTGELVMKRVGLAFYNASESFKKSEEGLRIAEQLADGWLAFKNRN